LAPRIVSPWRIAVDDAGGQVGVDLLPRALRAVGLRVDDDVREIDIVVARIADIVGEGTGALTVIGLEHLETHDHARQARGHVIGRAPEKSRVLARPGDQRLAPRHELFEAAGQLPHAMREVPVASVANVMSSRFCGADWKS
jgi:hypothetical protein